MYLIHLNSKFNTIYDQRYNYTYIFGRCALHIHAHVFSVDDDDDDGDEYNDDEGAMFCFLWSES